jgi:co-chaperonin GroES (HSP10)
MKPYNNMILVKQEKEEPKTPNKILVVSENQKFTPKYRIVAINEDNPTQGSLHQLKINQLVVIKPGAYRVWVDEEEHYVVTPDQVLAIVD